MQLGIKKIQILKHNVDEINFEFKLPITKSVKKLVEMKALSIIQNPKIKKKVRFFNLDFHWHYNEITVCIRSIFY